MEKRATIYLSGILTPVSPLNWAMLESEDWPWSLEVNFISLYLILRWNLDFKTSYSPFNHKILQCAVCALPWLIFFSLSVPQPGSEWASAFLRDQGQSSDSSMARFNGETGVNIPESLIASDAFPTHKFTIASWMRHRHNKGLDKHTKEHILCKADDHRE